MRKKNLNYCPVCNQELVITSYYCDGCGTRIEGEFTHNKFSRLSQEQMDFVEVFVMKRGNIKEIEKELDISYPTVRNKLDSVIEALGHKVERSSSKLEVLELLDKGEISAEEATSILKNLGE